MNLEPRWWGPILGTLHSFESLVDHKGETLIRTAARAACGAPAPGGILESPLDGPDASDKLCRTCREAVETKPCDCCQGSGRVEVCAYGHTVGGCPCPGRMVDCLECDGRGRVELLA